MNDIQLRLRCMEMAIGFAEKRPEIDRDATLVNAKAIFDWITQGAFGPSDIPAQEKKAA